VKSGRLGANEEPGTGLDALVARAQAADVITPAEADAILIADELTAKVIRVDDFAQDLGAIRDALHVAACSATSSTAKHKAASDEQAIRTGTRTMSAVNEPIYIIDGDRTPFLKSRNRPGPFAASDLATQAGRALLLRQSFAPTELDEVILGCAAPSVDEVNIGRSSRCEWAAGRKCPAGR
jgi:hypothetical protein